MSKADDIFGTAPTHETYVVTALGKRTLTVRVTDPKIDVDIDWASMTPRQVLRVVDSAPKVAGPWLGSDMNPYNHRFATVRIAGVMTYDGSLVTACKSESERAAADARLRAEGWLLVDDEPKEGA